MRCNSIKCLLFSARVSNTIHTTNSTTQTRYFHSQNQENLHTWSILNHLYKQELKSAKKKYACFLLNISDKSYKHLEDCKYIWNDADLRVAVDGSADCLARRRVIHTADIVCGDFDSISPKILEELRCPSKSANFLPSKVQTTSKMPQVIETPSQKETDFTKAIRVATKMRSDIQFFFGLYFSGGERIDHLFGLINTLHLIKRDIILVNVKSNTVSWLLMPGSHKILKPRGRELCSLVPFTGPAEVKSQGLEYNLSPTQPAQFGGLISTSNICSKDCDSITVETNRELLLSIDVHVEEKRETI